MLRGGRGEGTKCIYRGGGFVSAICAQLKSGVEVGAVAGVVGVLGSPQRRMEWFQRFPAPRLERSRCCHYLHPVPDWLVTGRMHLGEGPWARGGSSRPQCA